MIIHQHADCGKATAMALQWVSCSAFRVQRSAFSSFAQKDGWEPRTKNQEPRTVNSELLKVNEA